jgi:hypothetical protein
VSRQDHGDSGDVRKPIILFCAAGMILAAIPSLETHGETVIGVCGGLGIRDGENSLFGQRRVSGALHGYSLTPLSRYFDVGVGLDWKTGKVWPITDEPSLMDWREIESVMDLTEEVRFAYGIRSQVRIGVGFGITRGYAHYSLSDDAEISRDACGPVLRPSCAFVAERVEGSVTGIFRFIEEDETGRVLLTTPDPHWVTVTSHSQRQSQTIRSQLRWTRSNWRLLVRLEIERRRTFLDDDFLFPRASWSEWSDWEYTPSAGAEFSL